MAVITVLVTCLPLAGPARSGSVTDKVFVQCAVVQGNGYNWASTLGWLAAQVELVALRARAFEASEPARRAAIDLSCFVGSSSGGFVAAVMDNLLSNGSVRDGAAVPDGRLLNGEEALEVSRGDDEPFIGGGAYIYRMALARDLVDRLYLTRIHAEVEGDTFLPDIDFADWGLASEERHEADEKNEYACTFEVWERP